MKSVLLYVAAHPDDRNVARRAAVTCASNFLIATADGLFEAIDYLRGRGQYADRQRHPLPSLIMVDSALGNCKATDLVRCIRNENHGAKLPVVILGENRELVQVVEAYASGADYYVIKGSGFESMVKVMDCLDACLAHTPPRLKCLRRVGSPGTRSTRLAITIEPGARRVPEFAGGTAVRRRETRPGKGRAKGSQKEDSFQKTGGTEAGPP